MVQIPLVSPWLQRKTTSLSQDFLPLRTAIPYVHASYAQLKWIVRREASLVTQPAALLLHSRNDPHVPWENTLVLKGILSSRLKRAVFVHKSNHALPLDLGRDLLVEEIATFFLKTCAS